ncbi:hypothetical protein D3C87_58890 [compost metagenome]
MKEELLLKAGVRHTTDGGNRFFSIKDIKERFPEHKVDTSQIRTVDFAGVKDVGVQAKDIHPMTDWDKLMIKTINFRDKLK